MGVQIMFRKAERKKAKLRLALCGVAGSGKTYGALSIASGLGEKIALLDTERGSGELYSKEFNYDVSSLDKDFSPTSYIKIILEAQQAGYDVLIIDSLSHAWCGEGGVLDMVDKAAKSSSSGNSYVAWRNVTPAHNALVDTILKSNMHIIVTMRSKMEYVICQEEKRSVPKKIGLAPIQREGLDYEFTVVFDLSIDGNIASSSKDRTKLFNGKNFVLTKETGVNLLNWLEDGKSIDESESELLVEFLEKLENCDDEIKLKKAFAEAWNHIKDSLRRNSLKERYDFMKKKMTYFDSDELQLDVG